MAVLNVIKMGNPILRELSEEITESHIISPEFQSFIKDLVETMRHNDGAGIAAPQVGVLKRVFTMEMKNNARYPDKETFPLHVVINPEIEYLTEETTDSWEGCLSIPNIRGRLRRYTNILLKGYSPKGENIKIRLQGFAAVVAQHELDHLNGILLIDRMDSMKTLTFQDEYEKYWL